MGRAWKGATSAVDARERYFWTNRLSVLLAWNADNFESAYEYPWYDQAEFEDLGIPINKDYFAAGEACYGEFISELPERILDYENRPSTIVVGDDGCSFDIWQKLVSDMRLKLKELKPLQVIVDEVEAQFVKFHEIAWAKVFQLLASGIIISEAIKYSQWEEMAEKNEHEMAGVFSPLKGAANTLWHDGWLLPE